MPSFVARPDGARIAFERSLGQTPGVVFLGGFMSDMTGTKATALEEWCQEQDRAFVRFDYLGHGISSGRFEDGTIGRWTEDALAILDEATEGPQVLVGSSMGGWIALLAAVARPSRVAGIVGIAAAPDFTRHIWEEELDDDQRAAIERDGKVSIPSAYSEEGYVITQDLIGEADEHMLLDGTISLTCPVRLLHGLRDEAVSRETPLRLAEALESTEVEVMFVKDGDHRLSEPQDIERLQKTLESLLGVIKEDAFSSASVALNPER